MPTSFDVDNTGGTSLELTWDLMQNATGYEVQRSINGLADPDGLWVGGFGKTLVATDKSMEIEAYRSYYFRIRSVEETSPGEFDYSLWTDPSEPLDGDPRPANGPEDNTVKVSAIAHSQIDVPLIAAKIELRWPLELAYEDADYKVYRKEKNELSFDDDPAQLVADLDFEDTTRPNYPAPFTGWTDDDLGTNTAYEYKVERTRKTTNHFFTTTGATAIGYVYAGVDVPLDDPDSTIESPGTVILIVDNTQAASLATELTRLEQDLIAEGWGVLRHDVAPHDDDDFISVANRDAAIAVRELIKTDYLGPADVTSVFVIGHVPIPMSGHNCPDGHGERPMPTDLFYGEMDGVVDIDDDPGGDWTDATQVPNEFCPGSSADVDNNPNDGAFDQKDVPTDGDGKPVELMVGRVDMRGLPNFQQYSPGLTEAQLETELLRRYLDKDHVFRSGQVTVERGALIRDQFAFPDSSTGAWQTMNGLFGPAANPTPEVPDNIDVADFPEPIWPLAVGLRSIDSADLDNDGDADFLTASYDDNRIAWYENVGGDFSAQHIISDDVLGASAVIAADLNNDGCDDVVAASAETGEILWYDNDIDIPTGTCQKTFAQQPLIEDPLRGMSSVFAIDLDGDGNDDVLSASKYDDSIAWYDNTGSQAFTKRTIASNAGGASSAGAAENGGIIPRKYLTRASTSDIMHASGRGTLLAIAI